MPSTSPSRWLVRIGAGVVVALAVFTVVDVVRGSLQAERLLRDVAVRGARIASEEWIAVLHGVAGLLTPADAALMAKVHQLRPLPEELARDVVLSPAWGRPPADEWRARGARALSSGAGEWWEFVDNDLSVGLRFVRTVSGGESCGGCHVEAAGDGPAAFVSFLVPTGQMARALQARQRRMMWGGGVLLLGASIAVVLVVALAVRRTRADEQTRTALFTQVKASETRFRTLVDHALVGIYVIQGGRFLFVNRRFSEMFGVPEAEILDGVRVEDLVAPEDRPKVAEQLRRRIDGEIDAVRYEFTALARGGRRFPVEVFGARVMLPAGPAVQGMIVDNSERDASVKALEAGYRAVVGLPGQDVFAAAAESLATLLGAPAVLVSRREGDWLDMIACYGPICDMPRIPIAATPCARVIEERRAYEVPHGLPDRYPDCSTWARVAPESYFGAPLADDAGEVLGVLAVLDVVPRRLTDPQRRIVEMYAVRLGREMERRRLEERERELEQRLLQSQKLEALGVMAGGIAHDFNNVLAGIAGNAEMLDRVLPDGDARTRAAEILTLARRGGEVVGRVLGFARSELPSARAVDLSATVEEATLLARHALGPEIDLAVELAHGLPLVDGDPGQLQQALLNLLLNARDALDGRGGILVRTRRGEDGSVLLEVEDAGCGIPPEVLPRIFEPFFTTKPAGEGSGLGLSMVYGTVAAHGGRIVVRSRPGATVFTIALPAGGLLADPPAPPTAAHPHPPLTVLVVDDEPAILRSLCDLLRLDGHRPLAAADAVTALELFAAEPGIDVALLDVAMPGASGAELARELRWRRPELPLVFSSGHAQQKLDEELLRQPCVEFLQKPYDSAALLAALARVVRAGATA